jgi:phosphomannomutase
MGLTKYEQETIINYNQAEKNCSVYTHDAALIRKIDKLIENGEEITVINSGDGVREYSFAKQWIKVRPSRKLSDEKRAELAERMKSIRKVDSGG